MSNTGSFLLNSLVGVSFLSVAGAIGLGYYQNKERPLPARLQPYDNSGGKKDGKLDSTECLAVAADLVDVNHNGQIDDDELNTTGRQVVSELRDKLGSSNLSSAAQLESTIQAVHDAPRVLSEWQAAVNRAKLNK